MRALILAAAAAVALAGCGQLGNFGGDSGPPLPRVQAGATPPSTQSPASPTEQTEVSDEVRQQLIAQANDMLDALEQQVGAGQVSRMEGQDDVVVPMQPGRDYRFVVDLTGGRDYGFIGVCDGDCTNLDMELISMETGGVVANDMLTDDIPVVGYTPDADGQYMVRMLMQACSRAPCYAGARALVRGAPQQQPTQDGGGK